MKRSIFITLLTGFAFIVHGQNVLSTRKAVKPLTPDEVSARLIPPLKLLAFAPPMKLDMAFIKAARKADSARKTPVLKNADSLDVKDMKIPGLNKGDALVPVRIYTPKYAKGPLPCIVWFHGGGFVAGNLNSDHQACANLAVRSQSVVVSVDYRLAPEHIFPAGVNDGYAAVQWSLSHAAELRIDKAKLGVGGGSAGAGIAGSIVLKARAEKGPAIKAQFLVFPPADVDTTHVSVIEFRNIPGVKGADLLTYTGLYLGEKQSKNLPDYALPGLTKDFSHLPSTYVITCGVDPLRDGGLIYGQKLIEAGVFAEVHNYAGYPHGMLPERANAELAAMAKQLLNQ